MKRKKIGISLSKHAGIDVYAEDSVDTYLPNLMWEIIYTPKGEDFSKTEYLLYNAGDEPSKEEYSNTNLCPGEVDEINLVDEYFEEVEDVESWVDEQIDILIKRKPRLIRKILKERILGKNTIEEDPKAKRSFAWDRSLAEIAHILEKENSLPKGCLVFRKKGKMLNLRKKLAYLHGKV